MSTSLPDNLLTDLAAGRVVAYLGAGFTAVCGLPGWGRLLERLISDIDRATSFKGANSKARGATLKLAAQKALDAKQFSYCASLVQSTLQEATIREVLNQTFGLQQYHECAEPDRIRMKRRALSLFRTPFVGIITTNYDQVVEELMVPLSPRRFTRVVGLDASLGTVLFKASEREPFFFKMHGTLETGPVVLSTESYDRIYLADPVIRNFLSATMLRYALLFIGCSLEDQIVALRRQLLLDFKGIIPPAYAILPLSPENEARSEWLENYAQINVILYDNKKGAHQELDKILEDLSEAASNRAQIRNGRAITRSVRGYLGEAIPERMLSIGTRNRAILTFIASRPGRKIEQSTVVQLLVASETLFEDSLLELNAEEFVYRVMFLHQIGLVDEIEETPGRVVYAVPDEVSRQLAKTAS
ncbi:SIR2 family protein [Sphingomonas sp. CJ99]